MNESFKGENINSTTEEIISDAEVNNINNTPELNELSDKKTTEGPEQNEIPDRRKEYTPRELEQLKRIHELEEELDDVKYYDELTGLHSKLFLKKHLKARLEDVANPDIETATFAVIFGDIDNFKYWNSKLKYEEADKIIINVAEKIKEQVRDIDIEVRRSGDEFVIILNNLDGLSGEKIKAVFENIYKRINAALEEMLVRGNEYASVSMGYETVKNGDERSVEKLLDDAAGKMANEKDRKKKDKDYIKKLKESRKPIKPTPEST